MEAEAVAPSKVYNIQLRSECRYYKTSHKPTILANTWSLHLQHRSNFQFSWK